MPSGPAEYLTHYEVVDASFIEVLHCLFFLQAHHATMLLVSATSACFASR